jgi:hypothetical protein
MRLALFPLSRQPLPGCPKAFDAVRPSPSAIATWSLKKGGPLFLLRFVKEAGRDYTNLLIASIPFFATSTGGRDQYSGLNISSETGPS